MLCSEAELGLGLGRGDDDGILVLARGTAEPGTPLCATRSRRRSDTIFEIGVTPEPPRRARPRRPRARARRALRAAVRASRAARRRRASRRATVDDARHGRSSRTPSAARTTARRWSSTSRSALAAWLRYRLASLGVRPISNVVDVTNLVMLEFGHPMHAFDLDRVRGHADRRAPRAAGEKLVDARRRRRARSIADDLVICDGEGPVALAGIMGGAEQRDPAGRPSACSSSARTSTPRGVRRSSRRHGMHTESSHRFERGVDPRRRRPTCSRTPRRCSPTSRAARPCRGASRRSSEPARRAGRSRSARRARRAARRARSRSARRAASSSRLGFGVRDVAARARDALGRRCRTLPPRRLARGRPHRGGRPRARPRRDPDGAAGDPRRSRRATTGALEAAVRAAAVALGLSEAITYGFVVAEGSRRPRRAARRPCA